MTDYNLYFATFLFSLSHRNHALKILQIFFPGWGLCDSQGNYNSGIDMCFENNFKV